MTGETIKRLGRGTLLVASVAALAACMATDDTTHSRLTQPVGANATAAVDVDDIVIAGQQFAHAINDLPQVAGAAKPPLVQFGGVTSIVNGPAPVDTEPYTNLLRDRLLLITRNKLRFVERQLPQLHVESKKSKKHPDQEASEGSESEADYEVLAELRGNDDDDRYRIQIQFVDIHTGEVLYNVLYRIRKELPPEPSGDTAMPPPPVQDPTQPAPTGSPALQ